MDNETKQKTYDTLSKDKLVLKSIEKSEVFKELVKELPDNTDKGELIVSFSYDEPKDYIWEDNTLVSDNNISNKEIRKKMKKVHLTKGVDKQGRHIVYPEE